MREQSAGYFPGLRPVFSRRGGGGRVTNRPQTERGQQAGRPSSVRRPECGAGCIRQHVKYASPSSQPEGGRTVAEARPGAAAGEAPPCSPQGGCGGNVSRIAVRPRGPHPSGVRTARSAARGGCKNTQHRGVGVQPGPRFQTARAERDQRSWPARERARPHPAAWPIDARHVPHGPAPAVQRKEHPKLPVSPRVGAGTG